MKSSVLPFPESLKTIVVIGNGMVGYKFCEKLVERGLTSRFRVVVFGEEALPAYDRIHLTDIISSRTTKDLLLAPHSWYGLHGIELYLDEPIRKIDRVRRVVMSENVEQHYDWLVLATGSRPHVPDVEGIASEGVLVYRKFEDLESIVDLSLRAKSAVVIGGGLLGLEAAKALKDLNISVHVVHNQHWLMGRQLDEVGGNRLQAELERFGIEVHLDKRTTRIERMPQELVVKTADGLMLRADMVVVAVGIRPRDDLAAGCGLALGQNGGALVDVFLQTSDPNIFAIGECANLKGRTFGVVAPIYAMAEALARHFETGRPEPFVTPVPYMRLKPMGVEVATIGNALASHGDLKVAIFSDALSYRKLVLQEGRVVGALTVGEFPEFARVQEVAAENQRLSSWQVRRFAKTGRLWKEERGGISSWPPNAVVCTCLRVTRGQLSACINAGSNTVESLAAATGASTVCGGCRPLLATLSGEVPGAAPKKQAGRGLIAASGAALLFLILLLLAAPLPFSDSMLGGFKADSLWHNSWYQQISGYILAGLAAFTLLLSFRKRVAWFKWGSVGFWRVVHAVLGALILAGLVAHTGLRLGSNLNFILSLCILAASFLGALAGVAFASSDGREHLGWMRARNLLNLAHLFSLAIFPLLLLFHIISVYYF